MSGTNHFQSIIGEDGIKRWKYIGPPIEWMDIDIVGGPCDGMTYKIIGMRLSEEVINFEDSLYQYNYKKHAMLYLGADYEKC